MIDHRAYYWPLADIVVVRSLSLMSRRKSPRNAKPKSRFDALMNGVSVGWGYCGSITDGKPMHVDSFIPSEGPVSAGQFVEWLFLAENRDPGLVPKSHWRGLQALFVKHMGSEVVDAKELRWSAT
jgi:hypothetical protein